MAPLPQAGEHEAQRLALMICADCMSPHSVLRPEAEDQDALSLPLCVIYVVVPL
jgi:hypothetical protein